jgi:hypothetical protein
VIQRDLLGAPTIILIHTEAPVDADEELPAAQIRVCTTNLRSGNALRVQIPEQNITIPAAHHMQVPSMSCLVAHLRHNPRQTISINRSQGLSFDHVRPQGSEFHLQDGGLHLVQAAVHPLAFADLPGAPSILPD